MSKGSGKRRLVLIEWQDSFGVGAQWSPIDTPMKEPEVMICISIGWLAVDGKVNKVVVPHYHEANDEIGSELSGCGDMTIPTCCIVRMVDLAEAPK